jgi:hypothetical protein
MVLSTFLCFQNNSISIINATVSFGKKLFKNDDLRKRGDLRGLYGTKTSVPFHCPDFKGELRIWGVRLINFFWLAL